MDVLDSTTDQTYAQRRLPPTLTSSLFALKESEGAGYGVFASQSIPAQTELLVSHSPAAYVVYRAFRKEVCAWCFRYERGRNWKVRFSAEGRDEQGFNGGGMVFCREECRQGWYDEYGSVALDSYNALEGFIQRQARNQGWKSEGSGQDSDPEGIQSSAPSEADVDKVWNIIERQASLIRSHRLRGQARPESKLGLKIKKKALAEALTLPTVDTDLLFFLLSGVLCRFLSEPGDEASPTNTNAWRNLLILNPSKPYTSLNSLYLTVNAYLQLLAVLPTPLLSDAFLSRETFEAVLSRDTGNSFGIWSTADSDEDPEMLGYGIWSCASFFNHSCAPNVAKQRKGRSWIFHALPPDNTPIEGGTELCITYIRGEEDTLSVDERRKKLENGWGFTCRCKKCSQESASSGTSHLPFSDR